MRMRRWRKSGRNMAYRVRFSQTAVADAEAIYDLTILNSDPESKTNKREETDQLAQGSERMNESHESTSGDNEELPVVPPPQYSTFTGMEEELLTMLGGLCLFISFEILFTCFPNNNVLAGILCVPLTLILMLVVGIVISIVYCKIRDLHSAFLVSWYRRKARHKKQH